MTTIFFFPIIDSKDTYTITFCLQTEEKAKKIYTRLSIYIDSLLSTPEHHLAYVKRLWIFYQHRQNWFDTIKRQAVQTLLRDHQGSDRHDG